MKEFFGKYRGTVENNEDPKKMARLQVSVPTVLGDGRLSWAMPCVPYAGPNQGIFMMPEVGAHIWVEFEGGDPDYPIWSGCFWGSGEIPDGSADATLKMIKTDTVTITLNDGTDITGGISIETDRGFKIAMNSGGIEITNGSASVKLIDSEVQVNNSLEVN
jgi:hypothetical protein